MYPKLLPDLLWSCLFLDVLVLLARYGGMSVLDHLVHLGFLIVAALLLMLQETRHSIPPGLALACLLPAGVSLLQLVHLPPALLPYLAPLKHQITQQLAVLAPGLNISSQITLIPQLHIFKTAVLTLDLITICIAVAAPRPSRRLMRTAPAVLAGTVAGVVILSRIMPNAPLLSAYADTWGGLINPNHFAVLMIVLLLMIAPHPLLDLHKLWCIRSGDLQAPDELKLKLSSRMISRCGLVLVILIAFGFSQSRAGILLILIAPLCFVVLVVWKFNLFRAGRRSFAIAGLAVITAALLLTPFGGGMQRLETEGFGGDHRAAIFGVGLKSLTALPILGAGLGSSEAILEAGAPKPPYETFNSREFHNEYLQVAVELGLPGLFSLVLLLVFLTRHLLIYSNRDWLRPRDLIFVLSVCSGILVLLIHGLVSFPLRVTALRVLAIILTALAFKWSQEREPAPKAGSNPAIAPILGLALLLPFAGLLLISMTLRAAQTHPMDPPELKRALSYGSFHRKPMLRATRQLDLLLKAEGTQDELNRRINRSRLLFRAALEQHPKSLKSVNGLFMLEVIQVRLHSPGEDPAAYRAWRQKADLIQQLGHPKNHETTLAGAFLEATLQKKLNQQ